MNDESREDSWKSLAHGTVKKAETKIGSVAASRLLVFTNKPIGGT